MTVEPAWLDRAEYPFESRFLGLPSGRVHYVDEGAGEPVLLVHGTPTWSFEFRVLIRALAPSQRVIAVDHLGFGLSERPVDFAYTPEAHAENLARFVDGLGLERFALLVHDFGGPIGLPLAIARPERIARLVVLNSFFWPLEEDPALAKTVRFAGSGVSRFLYRYFNASQRLLMPAAFGNRRKLTQALHRQYLSVFPDPDSRERVLFALARSLSGSALHYRSLWEARERLRRIPALLVWGLKDPAFSARALARFQSALPDAETFELPCSGHWPHEEEPEAVAARVLEFLAPALLA